MVHTSALRDSLLREYRLWRTERSEITYTTGGYGKGVASTIQARMGEIEEVVEQFSREVTDNLGPSYSVVLGTGALGASSLTYSILIIRAGKRSPVFDFRVQSSGGASRSGAGRGVSKCTPGYISSIHRH